MARDLGRHGVLMGRLGRAFRDDARLRITNQDGGNYAPLSKWTRARTGRRKALVTEKKNISFIVSGAKSIVVIGHTAKGDWSLNMHEKGFVTPGFSGFSTIIPLKNPSALSGVRGNRITIRGAKPSIVPARRVYATKVEATTIIRPIIEDWLRKIIRRAAKL